MRDGMKWSNQAARKAPCLLSFRIGAFLAIASTVIVVSSSMMMMIHSSKRSRPRAAHTIENENHRYNRNERMPFPEMSSTMNSTLILDDDVEKFKAHLDQIHDLLKHSYERILLPWKVNENVSVAVQEDGFGGATIRVRARGEHREFVGTQIP